MGRDMDLVRRILMECDGSECPLDAHALADAAHPFGAVAYHVDIMTQAGLVESSVRRDWGGAYTLAKVGPLTWAGCDFLDAVRSEDVWSRVKLAIGKTVGTVAFDTVKALAVRVASERLMG